MTTTRAQGGQKGGWVRRMLDGHSVLGIALSGLVYLVCLSGTVAIFADDIASWEDPAPSVGAVKPEAMDAALNAALAQADGPVGALMLRLSNPAAGDEPQGEGGEMVVSAYQGAASPRQWGVDAAGGVTARPLARPYAAFLSDLHISLTSGGFWGQVAVGAAGALLLALLVGGVLSHPRVLRDAFHLRLDGGRRLGWADAHNRLGVWGLPFHLAIAATGALLGLGTLVLMLVGLVALKGDMAAAYAALAGPQVSMDATPAPVPSLADLRAHLPATPRLTMVYIERPGTRGQRVTVEVAGPADAPRHLVERERYYFDGAGRLLAPAGFLTGGAGLRVYGGAVALHCGTWGGVPVRLLYGLSGLVLSSLALSGMGVWFARRADRGRPLPRLHRVWKGWAWGVPIAMAAALPAAHLGLAPAPCFWAIAALAPIVAVLAPWARRPVQAQPA